MKKLVVLISLFLLVILSACSKIEQLNGDQITEAYNSAREAMGWFQMTTMPHGNKNSNPNPAMPAGEIVFDENGAALVNHPTIKTYADLKDYLQSLFSSKITDELLSIEKYFDKDGELYTIPSEHGSNTNKGKETYEIIKESDIKVIYRVTVEDFSTEDLETVVGYTVHDMIYEYIGDKWVFTQFELVR